MWRSTLSSSEIMQLIWVSGPTSRVVTFSITARKVALALSVLCLLMVALGFLFHFIGLRVAVDYSPALVRSIGGVASVDDHRRMEESYRARVAELQDRVSNMIQQVRQLESSKNELLQLLGLRALHPGQGPARPDSALGERLRSGQGGPLRLLPFLTIRQDLPSQLDQFHRDASELSTSLDSLNALWMEDLQRLQRLPVSLPLHSDFQVSSGYGVRPDPFNGLPSLHEGIDFLAPLGTPVLSAAPGVVTRSERAADWGHVIEISHAEGYLSRYAHLSQRLVKPGTTVVRGTPIGLLGNTGRSTGPHLHYEIERNGRTLNPVRALAAIN